MARADYERRKRSAICPECGKKFSAQGLNGHLRFVHAKGAEQMQKTREKAVRVGDLKGRAAQTMQLAKQLKALREQRREVEEMDKSDFWAGEDKAAKALKAALDLSERELLDEVRKLTGDTDGESSDDDED